MIPITWWHKPIATAEHACLLVILLAAVIAPPAAAPERESIPFDVAKIIIEVNATAGDAGIQISVDATGWQKLAVFDPDGRKIFDARGTGSVRQHGITELFFESEEPSFDEVPLDEFLDRFPEGDYTFVGRTTEGERLSGTAGFTHDIPAGPEIVSPAAGAEVPANIPVVIDWEPVTGPFPGGNSAVTVIGYQVIVELEGSDPLRVFSVNLPASVTRVTISPEFIVPNGDFKFEVLAIEAGGNQTISERTFTVR